MIHFNQLLTRLAEPLRMPENHRQKVVTSANYLIKSLEKEFGGSIVDSHLFGSFVRGTNLNPAVFGGSDLDILIVFTDDSPFTPRTYRKHLTQFVKKYYKTSLVTASCPAVVLDLNHIRFELTSAIMRKRWFFDDDLCIPDGYGKWRVTDPVADHRKSTFATTKYGIRVLDIVRLLKSWNTYNQSPVKSFELEKQILDLDFRGDTLEAAFTYAVNELKFDKSPKFMKSIWELRQVISQIDTLTGYKKREKIVDRLATIFPTQDFYYQ